jgi:RNA polymerase sigma-70 factor (ECF subfamily)
LFHRHFEAVFSFAYRLSGSVTVAEEITQDCYLSVLQHLGRYDAERGSFRTYLYGIARNLFLKHLRSSGPSIRLEDSDAIMRPDESLDPAEQMLKEELSEVVQKAVEALPPLQREALVLFEYEGLALAEIARIVGADLAAVKSRLSRARENLRSLLAPYRCTELKTSNRRSIVDADQR